MRLQERREQRQTSRGGRRRDLFLEHLTYRIYWRNTSELEVKSPSCMPSCQASDSECGLVYVGALQRERVWPVATLVLRVRHVFHRSPLSQCARNLANSLKESTQAQRTLPPPQSALLQTCQ